MKKAIIAVFICAVCVPSFASVDQFASEVVSYSNLGASPYDDPNAVLGKPTTKFKETGSSGQIFACSLVASSWNKDINGNKIITTVMPPDEDDNGNAIPNTAGYIVVKFASPIEDDPQNWYGDDFIIYGNSAFNGYGTGYITPTTDMEQYFIASSGDVRSDPSIVSVSQDGVNWYEYTNGPYEDSYAPLQAYAWDYINHTWGAEMDFTKPVGPSIVQSSFGGISAAAAIDLYRGSAGGTAFDISCFDLPRNSNGNKWIQYIKVTGWGGNGGEVDGFSRVGHKVDPISDAAAKKLEDGSPVILENQIVSAGTSELGDCCYVEPQDRSCGIKLVGRIIGRGKIVTVYGVLSTSNGERQIQVTSLEYKGEGNVSPVGMPNKSVGGGNYYVSANSTGGQNGISGASGLNNVGLLVKSWGNVKSVDTANRTFIIDDGSGRCVKCIAPAGSDFSLPEVNTYAGVAGISSIYSESGNFLPSIKVRCKDDINNM